MRSMLYLVFSYAVFSIGPVQSQSAPPLRLIRTVSLPHVEGRIDHMAVDVQSQRLFVAALGNNTLEIIDIKRAQPVHTISGLREPQGVAFVPSVDRIFVANGEDGSLRIFDGASYRLITTVPYGGDADNVRYDPRADRVWVGYGDGALGMVNDAGAKLADVPLDAHPESFQLEKDGPRIFVNLPGSKRIAVVDRNIHKVIAAWTTGGPQANFPMALDEQDHRLFVVCRNPARLLVLDTSGGNVIASLPAVGDCDDVFYDSAHKRIYATGGEGAISVFRQQDADHYTEIAKIGTRQGARTGFFSPDLRLFFVAARREGRNPAEIRIYEVE